MDGMLFDEAGLPAHHSNLVPRATVRDMVRRRQAALDAFLGAYNVMSDAAKALPAAWQAYQAIGPGKENAFYGGIVAAVEESRRNGGFGARQSECESDYFKVRGFKNGNAHVWFKRDVLVEKVNKLLGEFYGAPIPEEREAKDDPLSSAKTSLAKNYGFFPTPEKAAAAVIERSMLRHPVKDGVRLTVLEPSAGTGNLASLAAKTGATVDCVEYQAGLADKLARSGLYRSVACADFLTLQPSASRLYDRVIMNPPFDRERDIDHVMHALKFLKPDGCLVAVMSAGTEFRETRKSVAFRELMDGMKATWQDLPANSFASVGTNVNTIVLRVFKDSRGQSGWW